VRNVDGFGGRCSSVDGEDGFVTVAAAAVASVAAAASALSKVSVGSLSRSQVGWGVSAIVLACSVVLLSSSGCVI